MSNLMKFTQKPFEIPQNPSSLVDQSGVGRFYTDWLIECMLALSDGIIIIALASLYVGMYLYISGMVRDMNRRFSSLADGSILQPNRLQMWTTYTQEVDFHIEIIG